MPQRVVHQLPAVDHQPTPVDRQPTSDVLSTAEMEYVDVPLPTRPKINLDGIPPHPALRCRPTSPCESPGCDQVWQKANGAAVSSKGGHPDTPCMGEGGGRDVLEERRVWDPKVCVPKMA